MSKETRFRVLTCAALLALPVLAISTQSAVAQTPVKRAGPPPKSGTAPVRQLPAREPTKEEFRKMPPNALLTVGGKQITKQAYIDNVRKEMKAHEVAAPNPLPAKFAAARARFAAEQQAKLQASNTKVFAEAARRTQLHEAMIASPAFHAIESESQKLASQYKSASPAEKKRIEARAKELHQQLRQMQMQAAR